MDLLHLLFDLRLDKHFYCLTEQRSGNPESIKIVTLLSAVCTVDVSQPASLLVSLSPELEQLNLSAFGFLLISFLVQFDSELPRVTESSLQVQHDFEYLTSSGSILDLVDSLGALLL